MTTLVSASLLLVTVAPVLPVSDWSMGEIEASDWSIGQMEASDWSIGEMEASDWSDQGVSTRRLVELLRRLADIIEDEEDSTQRPRLQTMTFVTPSDWCVCQIIDRKVIIIH